MAARTTPTTCPPRRAPPAPDGGRARGVRGGPEGGAATGYRLALPAPRHERLSGYRVLVLTEHPIIPLDDEIAAAIDALGVELKTAGASVSRTSELLPSLTEVEFLVERFGEVHRGRVPLAGASPPTSTAKDYFDCLSAQEALRRRW